MRVKRGRKMPSWSFPEVTEGRNFGKIGPAVNPLFQGSSRAMKMMESWCQSGPAQTNLTALASPYIFTFPQFVTLETQTLFLCLVISLKIYCFFVQMPFKPKFLSPLGVTLHWGFSLVMRTAHVFLSWICLLSTSFYRAPEGEPRRVEGRRISLP